VAALAEGRTPPCIVLYRVPDDETWRRTADELTQDHEQRTEVLLAGLAATATDTEVERRRAVLETAYEDILASLPYDDAPTATWSLPGGALAWDDLAARAVFECHRD
jgi:hypothetical protein